MFDRLRRALGLDGGETERPRVLALLLLALLVVSIATLIAQSRRLNEQVSRTAEAQVDNLTWFVAQAEVELLLLHNALLRLPADPGLADLAEATQAFDIFYSRVSLLDRNVLQLGHDQFPEMGLRLDLLRAYTSELAEVFDASPADPGALPGVALPMVAAIRPELRGFALDALHLFVTRTAAARQDTGRTLSRFSSLAIILVVILSAMLLIAGDLYRDLARRARTIARVSASLQNIISAAPEAVIVTDSTGRIRDFNTAAERIFGHDAAAARGCDLAALILPGAPAMAPPPAGPVQTTARHRSGEDLPVEITSLFDHDSDGNPIRILFLRDLRQQLAVETTLRRARDAARQNAAARSRFLAVMSHEMRTPLQSVLSALDLMARDTLTRAQRARMAIAAASATAALGQVEDLLDLARSEDRSIYDDPPQAFDPVEVARDLCDQAGVLAAERGNRISLIAVPAGAAPGLVQGQLRCYRRALGNLVSNAVKFTRNGTITVQLAAAPALPPDAGSDTSGTGAADAADTILTVSVSDTGIGIAPEDQPRIFDDFETLDTSLTRDSGGTGLGLGIVRRAVAAMGGTLTVQSTPGLGSRFTFTAAVRRQAQPPRPLPARDTAPETPRLVVLLAEDTAVNRALLREMLVQMGHEVIEATDGAAAVARAAARGFDAIIMDISMPVMDGLAATTQIRAGGGPSAATPVMGLTAHVLPEDAARFAAAGIDRVVSKPVRYSGLEAALADLVRPPNDPLLDRAVVTDAAAMLPPDVHAMLIDRFEQDLRQSLSALAGADAGDRAALRHAMIGAAGMMGARRLRRRLMSDEADALVGRMTELQACLAVTVARLRAEIARGAPPDRPSAAPQMRH